MRLLVSQPNAKKTDETLNLLAGEQSVELVGVAQDGHEAAQLAVQLKPDVVLLDRDLSELDGMQAAQMIWLARPETVICMTADHNGQELLRQAMRSGVRDVLARPFDRHSLLKMLSEAYGVNDLRQSREFNELVDPSRVPRVISVTGAKGGVGKSTIAVNVAVSLAQQWPDQVVLVDMYQQFGDVSLMLNLKPKRTLFDLLQMAGDIDQEVLMQHLMRHESGLHVLAGMHRPRLDRVSTEELAQVLSALKRSFRVVVLDVPPVFDENTLYLVTHSTTVLLVANLYDLTTLNDTKTLYQTLSRDYVSAERLRVVLNRVARGNRLQVADVERTFGHPVAAQIPNDARVAVHAVNAGVPLVLSSPRAALAQSIRTLAGGVAAFDGARSN